MSLYEKWIKTAYDIRGNSIKSFFKGYIPLEQRIYEDLLEAGDGVLKGTVKEFSTRYQMKPEYICGFLDGIKEALDDNEALKIETVDDFYAFDFRFSFENLFRKMVEYKAKHLYTLPKWNDYFSHEEQERFISEQKKSGTFVRSNEKPGRNDPCPCGSGKKYKKCCGAGVLS